MGFITPIDKSDQPLRTFHINHVGPTEETKKCYDYIPMVVDFFSRFVWLYSTNSTGAEEVIDRLQQ